NHRETTQPAIVTHWCSSRVVVRCYELHVLIFESEIVNRFLDQIGVLVSYMTKLHGRHTNEQNASVSMTEAGGLQPGVVGMPIDFFLERVEDANPGIMRKACAWNRHKRSSRARRLVRAHCQKF